MSKQRWSGVLIGLALSLLLLGACVTTTAPTMAPVGVSTPAPTLPAPTPQVPGQVWTYSDEGVQITVPPQDKPVLVVNLPFDSLKELPTSASDEFEPFRPVISFEVQYSGTVELVQAFDPPIEIAVRYTSDDFANGSKEGKSLRLGFWDGSMWRLFTPEKHGFKLVPDGKEPSGGGWGVVLVSNWGDPMDAWGR